MIRVLIADDQEHFRHGLRLALEGSEHGIEVVGEAANGDDAVALARHLHPDVVLLDLRMPGTDGIHAAQAINRLVPLARILMLTISDDPDDIANATRAGAGGYLLKERSMHDVADAVFAVVRGQHWPMAAG